LTFRASWSGSAGPASFDLLPWIARRQVALFLWIATGTAGDWLSVYEGIDWFSFLIRCQCVLLFMMKGGTDELQSWLFQCSGN
jgi:hypothetical protein